ncbi:MAG: hypothetical protein US98_C0019G0008 [Parcubacteria group bacterium GW2011_GWC1_38_6]|nr:MAG: hypothetical protein US98_C0019G0008 [Parcubacteria group bacterium GW2011_GWC1_38_6]
MVIWAGILMLLAAALYTTAVLASLRELKAWHTLIFMFGFVSDLIGTHLMYLVSGGVIKINFHSFVGIFALVVMGVHAFWAIGAVMNIGSLYELFHRYSRIALAVWFIAFVTGLIIGMRNH